MESQRDFLARLGLLGSSNSFELQKAKKEYRKQYKREKNREYQKTKFHLKLTLSSSERSRLATGAKNHGKPLAAYVREIALAYQEKVYILPDEELLRRLEVSYRKIGNNINQIAKKCNSITSTRYFDVVRLQNQLSAMEKDTERYLRKPLTIEKLVQELPKHPQILERLKKLFLKKGLI